MPVARAASKCGGTWLKVDSPFSIEEYEFDANDS